MNQVVFIHGPGARDVPNHLSRVKHCPGSLAPTLPGHLEAKTLC